MTQSTYLIRRNPVILVALFVLPLVAAFLFISIQSVRGAERVIWDMEPDGNLGSAVTVGQSASISAAAGYFETDLTGAVSSITLEISARRQSSPGDLTIEVWPDAGGVPDVSQPLSGWSITVPENEFDDSYVLETFILEGDNPLNASTPYWVTFTPTAVDVSNYYQFRGQNDANPYPETWAYGMARNDGTSWLPWGLGQLAWKMTATVEPTGPQEIKVAVILAEPDGSTFTKTRADFEAIAADTEDYWCEVSFGTRDPITDECSGGLVDLNFTIFDNGGAAYQLAKDTAFYGNDFAEQEILINDNHTGTPELKVLDNDNTSLFVWDAINAADDDSTPAGEIDDFGLYDAVIAVHPGHSEQSSELIDDVECPSCISSQALRGAELQPLSSNDVGERARRWVTVSEFGLVGSWAHEVGHILELGLEDVDMFLPDTYPSATCCGNVGIWSLMAFGSGLGTPKGSLPSHISAYEKELLGWIESLNVDYGEVHVLESSETVPFGSTSALHFDLGDGSYYLLEARSSDSDYSKWDVGLEEVNSIIVYRVNPQTPVGSIVNFVGRIDSFEFPPIFGPPLVDKFNNVLIDMVDIDILPDKLLLEAEIQTASVTNEIIASARPNINLLNQIEDPNRPDEQDSGEAIIIVPDVPSTYVPDLEARRERKVQQALGFWYIIMLPVVFLWGLAFWQFRGRHDEKTRRRGGYMLPFVVGLLLLVWWILGVLLVADIIDTRYTQMSRVIRPSALGSETANLDIDLHAYDDQGNHIGVNYDTGAYENQIPGATGSGDLVYDEEWISVPEGTNVTFEVRSDDIEQFFAENPDIEASLASTEETYTFGAVTYDAVSQRYESAPVENITINPGETRVHTIGGTTEAPTVDEGVVMVEFEAIADTYLRNGSKNKNYGTETTTWIRGSGKRKTLVQFDQQAISDAVGTGTLVSATLELETVDGTAGSWTSNGKLVGAYRLTHPWTELGATWNCGNDTNTSDSSPDCDGETWEMNQSSAFSWIEPPLDQVLFTNDTTGTIPFDVTADVQAFLAGTSNYGWVVRKAADGAQGRIEFSSRETPTPPRLILEFVR